MRLSKTLVAAAGLVLCAGFTTSAAAGGNCNLNGVQGLCGVAVAKRTAVGYSCPNGATPVALKQGGIACLVERYTTVVTTTTVAATFEEQPRSNIKAAPRAHMVQHHAPARHHGHAHPGGYDNSGFGTPFYGQ